MDETQAAIKDLKQATKVLRASNKRIAAGSSRVEMLRREIEWWDNPEIVERMQGIFGDNWRAELFAFGEGGATGFAAERSRYTQEVVARVYDQASLRAHERDLRRLAIEEAQEKDASAQRSMMLEYMKANNLMTPQMMLEQRLGLYRLQEAEWYANARQAEASSQRDYMEEKRLQYTYDLIEQNRIGANRLMTSNKDRRTIENGLRALGEEYVALFETLPGITLTEEEAAAMAEVYTREMGDPRLRDRVNEAFRTGGVLGAAKAIFGGALRFVTGKGGEVSEEATRAATTNVPAETPDRPRTEDPAQAVMDRLRGLGR